MRIEVAKEGRMDMSGKGLIRAIQNDNMPILDLLVRESVQNSLDAAEADAEYVKVDFGVGEFDKRELADELEGITETINSDFPSPRYRYLYIRDSGTEGLTGALHFSRKREGKQNLLKLVYEIAKPQEGSEAGGSWGYGKTIYYRVGIGLVLYYSRIRTPNGGYQSRLAACLVEDENRTDALLRADSLKSKRGLAWWGQSYSYQINDKQEEGTIPETNEGRINDILSIFDFGPFEGDETGTAILIPFIDEKRLLTNNISQDGKRLPWGDSVEEYLKIAVQRWYIGRLNNEVYSEIHALPWLSVSVNDYEIEPDDFAEPFSEIQKLYNMALSGEEIVNEDGYYCEPINLYSYFENTTVGYVAYRMYTPGEMGMLPPVNNPNPFVFAKNEDGAEDYKNGDIILSYFRKPGMTVTYDTAGEWVNKIKSNNEGSGDVLLATFVLNSVVRFKQNAAIGYKTIEEYFRASERADHTSWYDININDLNPRFLLKIQRQTGKKISEKYRKVEERSEEKSSSLSKLFGDLLLPPEGFGKAATKRKSSSGGGSGVIRHKNTSLKIDHNKTWTDGDFLIIPVTIKADKPTSDIMFALEVVADGNNIPVDRWFEKIGIEEPFFIDSINIDEITGNGTVILKNVLMESTKTRFRSKSCSASLMKTRNGICYGVCFSSEVAAFSATMKVRIGIRDRMTQLGYILSEGGQNEA